MVMWLTDLTQVKRIEQSKVFLVQVPKLNIKGNKFVNFLIRPFTFSSRGSIFSWDTWNRQILAIFSK